MSPTDKLLVERWRTGRDPDAFAEIAARYAGMVYATCRRILGDASEAEDVAQECFLDLAQGTVRIRTSLGGWLHGAATYRSLTRLRSSRRRAERERRYAEAHGGPVEAGWDDVRQHVDEAVAALPDRLRIPLIAHFYEGRTYDELAQSLGLPRSTAAHRVRQAVERVREALREKGIAAPAALLASVLGASRAEAAPASLTASLATLSIAGTGGTAAVGAQVLTMGGLAVLKKMVVGLAAVVVIAGLWYASGGRSDGPTGVAPVPAAASPAEPVAQVDTETAAPTAAPGPAAAPSDSDLVPTPVPGASAPDAPAPEPASIRGSVVDVEDNPAAGADVKLVVTRDRVGYDVAKVFSAKTGRDGTYEIEGVDAFGPSWAEVSMRGYMEFPRPSSKQLRVAPGARIEGVDFVVTQGGFSVAGVVLSQDRKPIPGAVLGLAHYSPLQPDGRGAISSFGRMSSAVSDEDGAFELTVWEEGLCDFTVIKAGYGIGYFYKIPTGTRNAVCILKAPGAVEGTVKQADGKPAAHVRVAAVGTVNAGGDEDVPRSEKMLSGTVFANTDEQGRYRIEGLGEACAYTIAALDPGLHTNVTFTGFPQKWDDWMNEGSFYRGATNAKGSFVRHGVRVKDGQTTSGVNLALAPLAGIHGRVTAEGTGDPVYPIRVFVFPFFMERIPRVGSPQDCMATRTEPDGSYQITYDLASRLRLKIGYMYDHPSGADGYQDVPGVEIDLGPGESKEVNLTVPANVCVPVRCVDEDGNPRTDAIAGVRRPGEGSTNEGERVGPDGRVELRGLAPNLSYEVVAYRSGAVGRSSFVVGTAGPVQGKPGETLPEVTVTCRAAGGLRGVAAGEDGKLVGVSTVVECRARAANGGRAEHTYFPRDLAGHFYAANCLPAGTYAEVAFGELVFRPGEQPDRVLYGAVVPNVEIEPGAVADIGTVTLRPVSAEQWRAWFAGE